MHTFVIKILKICTDSMQNHDSSYLGEEREGATWERVGGIQGALISSPSLYSSIKEKMIKKKKKKPHLSLCLSGLADT